MIKKAVLLTLTAPFLMVFSDYSFASEEPYCQWASAHPGMGSVRRSLIHVYTDRGDVYYRYRDANSASNVIISYMDSACPNPSLTVPATSDYFYSGVIYNDEECSSSDGSTFTTKDPVIGNYLMAGGSIRTNGGACSVSEGGGVSFCSGEGSAYSCEFSIESTATGEKSQYGVGVSGALNPDIVPPSDFESPPYLSSLPGGCSDASNCVTIGDTSYLVDWSKAPDHFSYVGSDGNTYSNPNAGGGSDGDTGGGDPTDPTNPTDPTDPGGNDGGDTGGDSGGSDGGNGSGDGSGGSSGGGSSGGGSTVPDFEFDESGIIEAIRSSGQSNRNAINALSNDVTGSINNQTNQLNNATSAQTDALSGALSTQTDTLANSLNTQTDSVTSALDDQTGTLTGSLDALGTSIVDAINALGSGEGEGESDGEGTEGDGLLDGISNLFNGLVDDLASRFTEDLGDGDDLFNSSGLDETLDGLGEQQEQYNQDVHDLMDEIGDGSSSGIADQVTSRLPSLPSGSCTPLEFGPIEISCRPFDLIKSWLTWIIYFWTIVSIVDTFFRSGQRTA